MIRYSLLGFLLFVGTSFSSVASADSMSVSPNPVHVPPGGAASTTFTWYVNQHEIPWQDYRYACVYVAIDNNEASGPIDCERPGNTYHVSINWVTYPHTWLAMIVYQDGTSHVSGLLPPNYSTGETAGLVRTPFTSVSP